MDASGPTIRFLGDLDDPWVLDILGSISHFHDVHAVMCDGDVPDRPFNPDQPPQLLVLHRMRLNMADAVRIDQWRPISRANALPPVILCFSPYVRYAELERCSRGVDTAIPETTAVETLPRYVTRFLEGHGEPQQEVLPVSCLPVQVISSNHELRTVLSEICLAERFEVTSGPEFMFPLHSRTATTDRATSQVLTIWEVPVLEPDWPQCLQHRTQQGPVLALIGFADRATVGQARNSGAAACLDLPVDASDLVHVIGRISRKVLTEFSSKSEARIEPAHAVPPAPVSRARRGRAAIRQRASHPPVWSGVGSPSTIPNEKPS